MHGRDQDGELIRLDLIMSNIGGDDRRREAALRGRILIGHLVRLSHLFDRHAQQPKAVGAPLCQKTGVVAWKLGPLLRTLHPPVALTRLTGPIASLAEAERGPADQGAPNPENSPWEVERKIYGGDFLMLPPGTA